MQEELAEYKSANDKKVGEILEELKNMKAVSAMEYIAFQDCVQEDDGNGGEDTIVEPRRKRTKAVCDPNRDALRALADRVAILEKPRSQHSNTNGTSVPARGGVNPTTTEF